jgi:hypothetical protein
VSNKRNDISQINKYLQDKLDAKAMHQLERDAQDDPFLMDALEGYEAAGKTQGGDLIYLKEQLANRINPKKERSILLWRILPIAACILVMIGVGRMFFSDKPAKVETPLVVSKPIGLPDKIAQNPTVLSKKPEEIAPQKLKHRTLVADIVAPRSPATSPNKEMVLKADTVEYKSAPYALNKNRSVDELLKKMEGMEVDSNGYIAQNGSAITKIRVNGKEYASGSVQQALKNLPADIIEKIQVIDDYGDQAAKTGIKSAAPNKILNLATRSDTGKNVPGINKFYAYRQNQPLQSKDAGAQYFGRATPKLGAAKSSIGINKNIQNNPVATIDPSTQGRNTGLLIQNNAGPAITNATHYMVTGKVTNYKDGSPMRGAIISIPGKTLAQADVNGIFKVLIPAGNTATISYPGYISKSAKINRPYNLIVILAEDKK